MLETIASDLRGDLLVRSCRLLRRKPPREADAKSKLAIPPLTRLFATLSLVFVILACLGAPSYAQEGA